MSFCSGIEADEISFDTEQESYSVTIMNHMKRHFNNNDNQYKFDRKFFTIDEKEITHMKFADVCHSLAENTKQHCFLIEDRTKVWYRALTCRCDQCGSGHWLSCNARNICGIWRSHRWQLVNNMNANIPKKKRTRNTINKPSYKYQYIPHNNTFPPLINIDINCNSQNQSNCMLSS